MLSIQSYNQHPKYRGAIIGAEMLQKFFTEIFSNENKKRIIFTEGKAPNNRIFIILCFLDIDTGLVLLQIKPEFYDPKETVVDNGKNPVDTTNYEVMLAAAEIEGLGLRPIPRKPEEKFMQIGGPIEQEATYANGGKDTLVKKLFLITKFEKKIKDPENFFWLEASLLPKVFKTNNFFDDIRFEVLLEEIDKIMGYEKI